MHLGRQWRGCAATGAIVLHAPLRQTPPCRLPTSSPCRHVRLLRATAGLFLVAGYVGALNAAAAPLNCHWVGAGSTGAARFKSADFPELGGGNLDRV